MKITVCDGVAKRQLGNELFFITPFSSEVHTLNETGMIIFNILERTGSIRETSELMASEYEVEPDEVLEDIDDLLKRLTEVGILKIEE
ncbi:MAG: PqqD family protein [Deltaproteobacteria bacterium]|nr:PqqD family protein [Deltaproteobacteria bacterium]